MSRVPSLTGLFDSLAGTWQLHRDLESTNAHEPSGKCFGTATFTAREPSPVVDSAGKLQLADAEMLYHEKGEFQLPSMVKMPFSKKYIWRLCKAGDSAKMSVWFTKPGSEAIDYLFHNVHVSIDDNGSLVQGTGGHLCVEDFYSTEYMFETEPDQSQRVVSWKTLHEVRGPKKDQKLTTTFSRS